MIVHVKFLTVVGRGDRRLLDSYLFGHEVVRFMESDGRFAAAVRIEAPSDAQAEYLAGYQRARFQSGLIVATVHDTPLDDGDLADAYLKVFA